MKGKKWEKDGYTYAAAEGTSTKESMAGKKASSRARALFGSGEEFASERVADKLYKTENGYRSKQVLRRKIEQ